MAKGIAITYTAEQERFLRAMKDLPRKTATAYFNEAFGTNLTADKICQKMCRMGYKIPKESTYFKKGATPWNKGKKGVMGKNVVGNFKKGHIPTRTRQVGSERKNKYGTIEVKVSNPNKWRLRSHLVYEQAHGKGSIPKGYVVWHRNGNGEDDRLENLLLLKRGELAMMNSLKYNECPAEIKPVKEAQIRLKYQIGQKKRLQQQQAQTPPQNIKKGDQSQ